MTDTKPASTDVTLADELSHFQEFSEEDRAEHFADHIGLGLFGKVGDKEWQGKWVVIEPVR